MPKMLSPTLFLPLIFVFQFFTFNTWSQSLYNWNKKQSPEFYIQKFINSTDTCGLDNALKTVGLNFATMLDDRMAKLIHKAEKIAEKKYLEFLPGLYSLLRTYYLDNGDRPKSLEYALREYYLLSKTGKPDKLLWLLVDIGNLLFGEGDFLNAKHFYKEAEKISLKSNDKYALSVININFGLIAENENQFRTSLRYYQKSLFYRNQTGNSKVLATNYSYIAISYYLLGMPDSLLFYTKLVEDYYYNQGIDDGDLQIHIPCMINKCYAYYHLLRKENQKALEYIRKAKEYCLKNSLYYEFQDAIRSEVAIFYKMRDYEKGIQLMLDLLDKNKKNGVLHEQREIYKLISQGYMELKNYKKAAIALNNYKIISDSIDKIGYNSELNIIRTITSVYRADAKLNETTLLLEQKEAINLQQLKQRNISFALLGFLIALMILLLVFYAKNIRNKKKLQTFHDKLLNQNTKIVEKTIQLEKSNEIRDKLFSVIGHDLRNPLNRLLVEFSILEKSLPPNVTVNAMTTLKETISLFESLLLWSKMDNKQTIYSPAKVETQKQICKIMTFFEPQAETRKISLTGSENNFIIFADTNIFQTILRNLVCNAMHALPEGGKIEIKQTLLDNEMLLISVCDSGPGFPESTIRKFYSEEEHKSVETSGLGLMLCKTLAKISHWSMDISNDENDGARINIVIPLYKERKKLEELKPDEQIVFSQSWKEKLSPIRAFKYYQTSDIRKFIRSLGEINEEGVRIWISHLESAVHNGDVKEFNKLLSLLD